MCLFLSLQICKKKLKGKNSRLMLGSSGCCRVLVLGVSLKGDAEVEAAPFLHPPPKFSPKQVCRLWRSASVFCASGDSERQQLIHTSGLPASPGLVSLFPPLLLPSPLVSPSVRCFSPTLDGVCALRLCSVRSSTPRAQILQLRANVVPSVIILTSFPVA